MVFDDALLLHRRGWSVLPIKPRTKIPALRSWRPFQTAPPTESMLRDWFRAGSDRGLAVVLGAVSGGLVCRDFDQIDAFHAWAAAHPDLASSLPQSITSRGRHVFFRCPAVTSTIHLPDGELRSNGAYVVIPPSIHPSGRAYHWTIPPGDTVPTIDDLDSSGLARCWSEGDVMDAVQVDSSSSATARLTDEDRENTGGQKRTEATEDDGSNERGAAQGLEINFQLIRDEIEKAIVATLPSSTGKRNRASFELARHLKSIPALQDADPTSLRNIVLLWHRRALPVITTKTPEETLADFYRAWPKVKFPAGSSPLRTLFTEALTEPFPACAARYPTEGVRHLVALCRRLDRAWHPQPFPLACRSAGEVLGVSHVTASSWLYLLTADGVLRLESVGSQASHRASRYRYIGGD